MTKESNSYRPGGTETTEKRQTKMSKSHSIRVRPDRWESIEKKAWQLSMEAKKPIKPSDVADALLFKGVKDLTLGDIALAKKAR